MAVSFFFPLNIFVKPGHSHFLLLPSTSLPTVVRKLASLTTGKSTSPLPTPDTSMAETTAITRAAVTPSNCPVAVSGVALARYSRILVTA